MRLSIFAVGNKMPAWVYQACDEYIKRLSSEYSLSLQEIPPAVRGRKNPDIARVRQLESEALLSAIPDGNRVVALDVRGQGWSSEKLATQMESWRMDGRDVSFLIGGPDGFDKSCLERADQSWSLSALTLPHPLVRIILLEQLFRASSILNNHPYHRAN